jgi:fermentation-respiration switch protein FrsA (DUF1100 family)
MELSWLVKTVGVLVLGYLLVVAGCAAFQRSLLYFPASALPTPTAAGAGYMREVSLQTVDGLSLIAWYVPAREDRATIVYFHGNAGSIADRVGKTRAFVEAGYGLLLVEYRGYGGNPGSPSEDGLYADGEAAYRFLLEQEGLSPDSLVLLGESLGTGVAVWLAHRVPVGGVMLEAPFTSVPDVAQRAYFFLPARHLVRDRFDSLSRIADIGAPLLVVHGEQDSVVSVDFGRALFAAARPPKQAHFLEGAGHNDMPAYGLIDLELAFLEALAAGEVR